jgi:MMPL family protein
LLALLGIGLTSAFLASALTSDSGVTSKPESLRAQDLIDERLPGSDPLDELVIVRSERLTVRDAAFAARVRGLAARLRGQPDVRRVATYLDRGGAILVSRDGHATLLPVVMTKDPATTSVDELLATIERANGAGGFAVHITGENTINHDFTKVSEQDLRKGEMQFGLPAALIVLVLVFGTLVGAAIPLVMALLSIVVAMGLIGVIGQAFQLNLFVVNMLVAMGLALGIDYSLFIVSRLREERHHGASHRDAILNVANTATRAVVFSGCAFVLAMLGMFLMPDATLRSLAVGAIVVGAADRRLDGRRGTVLGRRGPRCRPAPGPEPRGCVRTAAGRGYAGARAQARRSGPVVAAGLHGGKAGPDRARTRLPGRRDDAGQHRRRRPSGRRARPARSSGCAPTSRATPHSPPAPRRSGADRRSPSSRSR